MAGFWAFWRGSSVPLLMVPHLQTWERPWELRPLKRGSTPGVGVGYMYAHIYIHCIQF
jgi:hypothetical protein